MSRPALRIAGATRWHVGKWITAFCSPNDLREKSKAQFRIKAALDLAETNGFPSWVEVDPKNFKGTFKQLPDRAEFASDVNEQLVVELYSK